jgi:gluconokinase
MHKHALIVMGVSGSGKTTVAGLIAGQLGWSEADADNFHSAANVAKMHAGIPLTDGDRASWLVALRDWITASDDNVVLACSALKRAYRDELRQAKAVVSFVQLSGSHDLIMKRMGARHGHFMPAELLDSQLATLEPLQSDEQGTRISIEDTPKVIADRAISNLDLRSDQPS